jgi:UPF0716 family protein affecting phage T7 exclusion
MWGTLAALVLSLAAAVWGAMIGRKQVGRRLDEIATSAASAAR